MTATVLFVDDEADLEELILQKFRRQIREGKLNVVFARDGIEALEFVEKEAGFRLDNVETGTFFFPTFPMGPGDEQAFVAIVTTIKAIPTPSSRRCGG